MKSSTNNGTLETSPPQGGGGSDRTLLHHEVVAENPNAPWLVFIHGAGGSIRTWKFQIEAFAPHFRLLLIDLRDHGYSKEIMPEFPAYDFDIVAKDILAVIDHLNIGKAHFMSLSIGSVILQKIDIERPQLVDRMIMAGAIFDGSRLMHWFVHSGKLLSHILPYRALYWLFSFIVLPRRNHRLSRYIFPPPKQTVVHAGIHEMDSVVQAIFQLGPRIHPSTGHEEGIVGDGKPRPHFLASGETVCSNSEEHASNGH